MPLWHHDTLSASVLARLKTAILFAWLVFNNFAILSVVAPVVRISSTIKIFLPLTLPLSVITKTNW